MILESLFDSIPAVSNVFGVVIFFQMCFAVMGLQVGHP